MRRPKRIFIGAGELPPSEKGVSLTEVRDWRTAEKDEVVFVFRHEDGLDYDMTKEEFDTLVETFRLLAEMDREQNSIPPAETPSEDGDCRFP